VRVRQNAMVRFWLTRYDECGCADTIGGIRLRTERDSRWRKDCEARIDPPA